MQSKITITWHDNTESYNFLDLTNPRDQSDLLQWILIAKTKEAVKIVIE